MNEIYNSSLEMTLRVVLITNTLKDFKFTIERLAIYDLIATYGKSFNISDSNLHGDNSFCFAELQSRMYILKNAIKEMIVDQLITFDRSNYGYRYVYNKNSSNLFNSIYETDYAKEYLPNILKIHNKYWNLNEIELYNLFNEINGESDMIE